MEKLWLASFSEKVEGTDIPKGCEIRVLSKHSEPKIGEVRYALNHAGFHVTNKIIANKYIISDYAVKAAGEFYLDNYGDIEKLVETTLDAYAKEEGDVILKGQIPILWFGDLIRYFASSTKIVTVSLNPSDKEFKENSLPHCTSFRFPDYKNNTTESLIEAYNNYFKIDRKPYGGWFKSSFRKVLSSFEATHFDGQKNIAIHTDICTPFATDPTWSNLSAIEKGKLESHGQEMWNALIELLEPDVILFSTSPGFYKKILFEKQFPDWSTIYQRDNRQPVLHNQVNINGKYVDVIYQTQGRLPFLSMNAEEKLNLKNLLETHKNGKAQGAT